jgi:mannose-6-phosphate isomerase-like protein (cupin superfamily)
MRKWIPLATNYKIGESDNRPWGRWEVLAADEKYVVKRIEVLAGQRLSLQYHHHRRELWRCVTGAGLVTLGADVVEFGEGDFVDIQTGTAHRIENTGPETLVFVEIQTGKTLDEDDIVRLEDNYGRVATAPTS